ncbi:hypothetical protein D3C72_1233650 [compost metagenome]
MTIAVTGKVTPQFTMTENPARLTIDLPGAMLSAPQAPLSYPEALVTDVTATQLSPSGVRLQLTFARPVGQNWVVRQTGSAIILVFDRNPVKE